MRSDLRPVLTHGRQRSRSYAYTRPLVVRDDEGIPVCRARDVSKGERPGWRKHRWSVIERALESRVGEPWARVHSELCAVLPPDLRSWHIDRRVETGCRLVDGEPVGPDGRGVHGFYEDPVDGCLRRAPEAPWRAGSRRYHRSRHHFDPDVLHLDPPHGTRDRRAEIRRLEGVWYRIVHVRHEAPPGYRRGLNAYRDGRHVCLVESPESKRQLATREIRDLRLREWSRLAGELRAHVDDAVRFERTASEMEAILAAARPAQGLGRDAGGRGRRHR